MDVLHAEPPMTFDRAEPVLAAPMPVLVELPAQADGQDSPPAPERRAPHAWLARAREFWFGRTDLAPLSLFRIVYGLLLVVWLVQLLPNLDYFFTDEGILPRSELLSTHPGIATPLLMAGQWWQVLLFWVAALALAGMVTVGYRTRLACGLAFLAVLTFFNRNPLVMDGSDFVFKLVPFWMMFTRAGQRWSVDAWLRRRRGLQSAVTGPSFPVRILELQLGWIYLATGLEKWAGKPWLDGTALYYVLQLSHTFTRPFMAAYATDPGIVRAMTWETLAVELAFVPLTMLLPGRFRLLAIAGAGLLQLGILTFMDVGNFPLIMLAMLTLFLPPAWVQGFVGAVQRLPLVRRLRTSAVWPMGWPYLGERQTGQRAGRVRVVARIGSTALLAAVAVASFAYALPDRFTQRYAPPSQLDQAIYFAGLDQSWQMFAPQPSNLDWSLSAPAQLSNGQQFDLLAQQGAGDGGLMYSRWTKLVDNMSSSKYAEYMLEIGRGLCRVYNNNLAPGQPTLDSFQIYLHERWIQPPGHGEPKTDVHELWTHHCF